MTFWKDIAADPRSTDELFETALEELDDNEGEAVPAWISGGGALIALHYRPTVEVLERAVELTRSSDADERLLGIKVLAEIYDAETGQRPAFVDETVTALMELAEWETDDELIAEIARAFDYRKDARPLDLLLGWMDHEDDAVRFFVANALPSCARPDNVERVAAALIELTTDEAGDVRDYALFGFPQLPLDTPEIRDAMLARIDDEDRGAAGQALLNLAELGDSRIVPTLARYLKQEGDRERYYGWEAATALGDPALLPTLRELTPPKAYVDELANAIAACERRT